MRHSGQQGYLLTQMVSVDGSVVCRWQSCCQRDLSSTACTDSNSFIAPHKLTVNSLQMSQSESSLRGHLSKLEVVQTLMKHRTAAHSHRLLFAVRLFRNCQTHNKKHAVDVPRCPAFHQSDACPGWNARAGHSGVAERHLATWHWLDIHIVYCIYGIQESPSSRATSAWSS